MFDDLYSYVPKSWRFYITEQSLAQIIPLLNKHKLSEIVPKKEDIFACFRSINPDVVTSIVMIEQSGLDNNDKVLEKLHNRLISSEYTDSASTLNELSKNGVLLLTYPFTAVKFHRKSHRVYGWDKVIKNIIFKLLYRENSTLCLIAWNAFSYYIFREAIGVIFPGKCNMYYTSPEYENTYLIVGSNITTHSPIATIDAKYDKEYRILSKQNVDLDYITLLGSLMKNNYC